jgi:hypothetical protein
MDFYNQGLDRFATWTTGDFRWLLLTGGSFNPDDNFVADVLDGFEVTVVGYARELVSTPTRTVNDTANRIEYGADDVNFGTLTAGENVTAAVLFEFVTNDADSIPVGWQTLTATATDAYDPWVLYLAGGLVAYTVQG